MTPRIASSLSASDVLRHARLPISGRSSSSARLACVRVGEIVVGGNDEDVGVAQQLLRGERAVHEREHRERDVELAALDEPEQLVVDRRLRELDLDARPGGEEAPHQLGQDACADALEGADAERARLALAKCGQVGLRRVQARDDRLGMAEEQASGLGERDGARPAWALEEPLSDDALQRLDLLADGRLRVTERLGGPAERAFAGHRLEGGQVAHFDAEPAIRFHDRIEA